MGNRRGVDRTGHVSWTDVLPLSPDAAACQPRRSAGIVDHLRDPLNVLRQQKGAVKLGKPARRKLTGCHKTT